MAFLSLRDYVLGDIWSSCNDKRYCSVQIWSSVRVSLHVGEGVHLTLSARFGLTVGVYKYVVAAARGFRTQPSKVAWKGMSFGREACLDIVSILVVSHTKTRSWSRISYPSIEWRRDVTRLPETATAMPFLAVALDLQCDQLSLYQPTMNVPEQSYEVTSP